MLLGRVTHSLDAKNRTIIPSKFAEELHGKLTLFPSITEYCIQLYDEPEWLKFYEKITALPDSEVHELKRYLFSNSTSVVPDSQNRVQIPQEMLDYAGIAKNVITVGVGDYCEIWGQETYERDRVAEKPAGLFETMKKLGL